MSRDALNFWQPDIRLRQIVYRFAADSLAADTRAQTVIGALPSQGAFTLYKIWIIGDDTVTDNASNYATLTVKVVRSSGDVQLASKSTTVESGLTIAQYSNQEVVLDAENVALAAGEVLTYEIAKAGDGVLVPSGVLIVEVLHDHDRDF